MKKYKYFQLVFPISGQLPVDVEDTGVKGGVDSNWCPGHVYKVNADRYINPDYIKDVSEKDFAEMQKVIDDIKKKVK